VKPIFLRTHGPGLRAHAIIHPFSAGCTPGCVRAIGTCVSQGGYDRWGAGLRAHGQRGWQLPMRQAHEVRPADRSWPAYLSLIAVEGLRPGGKSYTIRRCATIRVNVRLAGETRIWHCLCVLRGRCICLNPCVWHNRARVSRGREQHSTAWQMTYRSNEKSGEASPQVEADPPA
jgi:hypothetical protein